MKSKFNIGLTGYVVMGVIVLFLLVSEIIDKNGPMIGLDAALLGVIVYLIVKTVNRSRASGKK